MNSNLPVIDGAHYWIKTEDSNPFIAQARIISKVVVWFVSGSHDTHPNVRDHEKVIVLREVDPFIRVPDQKQAELLKQAISDIFDKYEGDALFVPILKRYREYSGVSLRAGVTQLLEYLVLQSKQNSVRVFLVLRDRYPNENDVVLTAKRSLTQYSAH